MSMVIEPQGVHLKELNTDKRLSRNDGNCTKSKAPKSWLKEGTKKGLQLEFILAPFLKLKNVALHL